MKLTLEQIDQLYTFTRQHYVEWYDVQSELVDHLANAIETEWELNPNRTFEEVLHSEFKKFGIFGFMDVVAQKLKMISKKYQSMIWNYYKDFFRLPRIVAIVSIMFLIYYLATFLHNGKYFIMSILFLICVWSGVEIFKLNRNIKKRQSTTGKKWLFENMIQSNVPFFFFFTFNILQICKVFNLDWNNDLYYGLSSLFLVLFGSYMYVRIKVIPPLIAKELSQLYPEYV